jgi:N4-gp56 family major capsid protein
MAGFTSLTNLPLSIKAKIDATVLMDPEANYVYAIASMRKNFSKGTGDTVRFPKYSRPEAFTTPLPESELDTDPQVLAKTFVDAQINYYGTYFLISERSVDQNPEDVLRIHAGALNSALRETEDILTRNILLGTSTTVACTSGENGDRPTEVTEKDLSTVVARLATNIAKPITSVINGSLRFGTSPVAQAYIGIFHPDLIPDFEALPDFKTTERYGSSYTPLPAEWGAYSRLRMLQTTQAPKASTTSALDNTVYNNLIMGADASTIIKQDSSTATIVGPNKVGALKDKYEYGIKTVYSAALLFEQFVVNLSCTRTTELV